MIRTRRTLSATLFVRALFSLTLLSAVASCARQDKRTTEQSKEVQEAREAFAKLGATYSGPAEPGPRTKPLFHINLYPPSGSIKRTVHRFRMPPGTEDRDLNGLPNPPFAFELDLSGTKVTDAGLKELAPLKNLTTLLLPGSVTDATLRALREAGLLHILGLGKVGRPTKPEEVVWLSLPGTVTDAGLKELAPLKNLTTLSLPKGMTDAGLKELAPFQSLDTLFLPGTVTDAGLKELTPLKSLTALHLGDTPVTASGLKELVPLKNLTTLSLPKGVTDAGLKELAALQSLTTLSLSDTKVTDAGLKELAALKNLTTLDLRGTTKVSDKGVETLQQALPKCRIIR